jgi:ubiquitin-protein ligase
MNDNKDSIISQSEDMEYPLEDAFGLNISNSFEEIADSVNSRDSSSNGMHFNLNSARILNSRCSSELSSKNSGLNMTECNIKADSDNSSHNKIIQVKGHILQVYDFNSYTKPKSKPIRNSQKNIPMPYRQESPSLSSPSNPEPKKFKGVEESKETSYNSLNEKKTNTESNIYINPNSQKSNKDYFTDYKNEKKTSKLHIEQKKDSDSSYDVINSDEQPKDLFKEEIKSNKILNPNIILNLGKIANDFLSGDGDHKKAPDIISTCFGMFNQFIGKGNISDKLMGQDINPSGLSEIVVDRKKNKVIKSSYSKNTSAFKVQALCIEEFLEDYKFPAPKKLPEKTKERFLQEISRLSNAEEDYGYFIFYSDQNPAASKMIVTGKPRSLYEYGIYIFDCMIPGDYPGSPPKLRLNSRTRVKWHPRIGDNGDVCLGILNTSQEEGEPTWAKDGFDEIFNQISSVIMETKDSTTYKWHELEIIYANIKYNIIDILTNTPIGYDTLVYSHFDSIHGKLIESIKKLIETLKSRPPAKSSVYKPCNPEIYRIISNSVANVFSSLLQELEDLLRSREII